MSLSHLNTNESQSKEVNDLREEVFKMIEHKIQVLKNCLEVKEQIEEEEARNEEIKWFQKEFSKIKGKNEAQFTEYFKGLAGIKLEIEENKKKQKIKVEEEIRSKKEALQSISKQEKELMDERKIQIGSKIKVLNELRLQIEENQKKNELIKKEITQKEHCFQSLVVSLEKKRENYNKRTYEMLTIKRESIKRLHDLQDESIKILQDIESTPDY